MSLTLEELKEKIVDNIDPDLLVEILNVPTSTLVERLEDLIEEKREQFADLEDEDENFI